MAIFTTSFPKGPAVANHRDKKNGPIPVNWIGPTVSAYAARRPRSKRHRRCEPESSS